MSNIKISELPAAVSASSSDILPIVQSNTTKKAALSLLPVSTATQSALDAKANASLLGQPSGIATLDAGGKLTSAQIPDIAVSTYLGSVASQAAMLALTGQIGDWATRSDLGTSWIITGNDPTQLSSWTQLAYPAAPVTSVNGQTGAVSLPFGDEADTFCEGNDPRIANIAPNSIFTNNNGGTILLQQNGGSINLVEGGSITCNGEDGLAGSINTSGANGTPGGSITTTAGGYINTSDGGGFINTSNGGGYISTTGHPDGDVGGYIDTHGEDGVAAGGNINTSVGGGSIDTRGTGFIELGELGTRTTLSGTATGGDLSISLPDFNGTLATEDRVTNSVANFGLIAGQAAGLWDFGSDSLGLQMLDTDMFGVPWTGRTWAISAVNITAARTLLLPDQSGTFALTSSTWDASAITSGTFNNARINWAAPSAIGSTTASTGKFTTLTATGSLEPANTTAFPPDTTSAFGIRWNSLGGLTNSNAYIFSGYAGTPRLGIGFQLNNNVGVLQMVAYFDTNNIVFNRRSAGVDYLRLVFPNQGGYFRLYGTDGIANMVIGYGAQATSITNNLAFGQDCLGSVTSAGNCIAIGQLAGDQITTGDSNVLIGQDAGGAITTGNANTAVGSDALGAATGATKSHNVAVGADAGNAVSSGSSNTILGSQANVDSGSRSLCIALGRGTTTPAVNGSLAIGGAVGGAGEMTNLVTTTAGGAAGKHLNIYLNGVQYKIALLNP